MEKDILLSMRGISKSFPGVKALKNVNFSLKKGSVHALMGENGAGKSTLMKCLFGVYSKDEGEIFLEGQEVNFSSSKEALLGGVAMVHQELNQALGRSVSDNIWLGRFPRLIKGLPFTDEGEMHRRTKELFEKLDIDINPREKMKRLSVSVRQMAEIAKAVSFGARVIVFDEPTSSLNDKEAERLFGIIDMLKREGCGIIYISHKMEEILRISDEVSIMRDGELITTRAASSLSTDEIIKLMVGRELSQRYPKKDNKPGGRLLSVENMSAEHSSLNGVSFELREGEILGVAGLDGSGRTELLECLFGIAKRKSGKITLKGRTVKNRTPREAIREGFAMVTEERRRSGIFSILGIRENTVISSLEKYKVGPFLSDEKMNGVTDEKINEIKVKTPSRSTKIRALSGGNQQKVIFSRWLLTEPTVLLLDEPTRGVDVGAKYEIYQLIISLAKSGRGVIIVSSEMPELIGISDRILVMSGGRLAGELPASASQEEIMALSTKFV